MSYEPKTTTNHDTIRKWVEDRGGKPARIDPSDREEDQAGVLRIDFGAAVNDYAPRPQMEEISWDDFFSTFENESMLFLYQDETEEGETSRFYKFVNRN